MPVEIIKWVLAERKYKKTKNVSIQVRTAVHPLQQIGEKISKSQSQSLEKKKMRSSSQLSESSYIDPLSIVLDGLDPLTSLSITADRDSVCNESSRSILQKARRLSESAEANSTDISASWEALCAELRKFTTTYPLTLASSFLSCSETGVVKVQSNIPDRSRGTGQTSLERVKARLEKLDSLDEVGGGSGGGGGLKEMGGLTQEQFIQHLLSLKEEMKDAFNDDQRVKALKIVIQCVKALSLSPPEMFYPCKFAVISDMLDTLGMLVHTRLLQLLDASHSSVYSSPKLEAEETARNWFYKITSIRDLLPRIYLETALLENYKISSSQEENTLKRLISMCRGIGDPLVGAYARAYIIHVGRRYEPNETEYIENAVEDLVTSCKWGWNGNGLEYDDLMTENIGRPQIVAERVFYPAFKWLMQCIPKTQHNLQKLLKQIENSKSTVHYVIINSVLETFPPTILCSYYKSILQALDLCFSHGERPHETLIRVANVVTECPPSEEDKFDILNGAWQLVVRINPAYNQYYLKTATAWLRFTANNFAIRDVDKILGDVLRRLSKSTSANHSFYLPLLALLTCALSSTPFSEDLYTLSSFRSLLSIFQRESVGSVGSNNVGELRKLLEAVIQYHCEEFSDISVVQLLLSLFATLHDGINALTTQDERRQITYLVNSFIRKVNYGKDFELQLQFYVDSRAVFSSLDPVLISLIQHVLRLQMLTYQMVGGNHTGKTAAFERACSAYCFITVPSLSCPLNRIKLYLITGAVAMINNCMGQGDACVKSAVKSILEIPSSVSDSSVPLGEIFGVVSYVSSFLIAFPDPPDAVRPLYLFRGLEKSLKSLEGVLTPFMYCSLNLAVLKGVCSCAISDLPYHFTKVDGNDILYGGDLDMKAEAEDISTELLSNILSSLKELIGLSDATQLNILCELLEVILQYGDISQDKLNNLAISLLTLINNISTNTDLKNNLKLMFEEKKRSYQQ